MIDKVCGINITYPRQTEGDMEGGLRISQNRLKSGTKERPLITYITVVYNRVDTMLRCMKSVWSQSYENIEYIIIDGKSTDGTLELIQEHSDKVDYYISQPDHGIYDAMNKGISLAQGQYICFMNSDDECDGEAAQTVYEEYLKEPSDIFCGSRKLYINGALQAEVTYPRACIKHSVFRYIQMYHQSTYASAEVFNTIGAFDLKNKLLSDWIWESKAIDYGFKIAFFEKSLSKFNYDGASFKGIVQRDNEWIRWIRDTFPALTQEEAETLLFALDRERQPLFHLKPLNQIAEKHQENQVFMKTYYETVILACIEDCINSIAFQEEYKFQIDKYVQIKEIQKTFKTKTVKEMIEVLKEELDHSCKREAYEPKWNLHELRILRDCIVEMQFKVMLKNRRVAARKQYIKTWATLFNILVIIYQVIRGTFGITVGTAYQCLGIHYVWHYGKTRKGLRAYYLKLRKRWNVE